MAYDEAESKANAAFIAAADAADAAETLAAVSAVANAYAAKAEAK